MKTLTCAILIAMGTAMTQAHAGEVDVTTHGAGDGKDDTVAFGEAIRACQAAPGSTLKLPKGQYDFFADPPKKAKRRARAMMFRDVNGLTIDGQGSTLMFHGLIGVMGFNDCRDVTVRDLVVDWDRPLFSHGTVVPIGTKSFDLKIDPKPGSGRIMSATADATHFNGSRGTITIEDCVFADTKRGPGAAGVHRDILIENNVFRGSDGAAIYVGSSDGVIIRGNTIEDVCRAPTKTQRKSAIFLRNSRNVTIIGNRIVGEKSEKMQAAVTVGPGCEKKTITVEANTGF